MATPNIVNVATINAANATGAVTTSRADIIDVAADKVAKVNTLLIANIDGSNAADITIEVSVDNGSNYVKIANTISVPADATLSFLENPCNWKYIFITSNKNIQKGIQSPKAPGK